MLGLGHRVRHGFASDTNPHIRNYLKTNFKHAVVYDNIQGRNNVALAKKLHERGLTPDLYTAGWPCTPISTSGNMMGTDDPTSGTVGLSVVITIKAVKPKTFVLENVPGVATNPKFKDLYDAMMSELRAIKASGGKGFQTNMCRLDAS
eukprot:7286004-Pyramimonas_sp.AAC.1